MTTFVRPEATATITVTDPVFVAPGEVVQEYAHGFEGFDIEEHHASVVYEGGFNTSTGNTSVPASDVFFFDFETDPGVSFTGGATRNNMSSTGNQGKSGVWALFRSGAINTWLTDTYTRTGLTVGLRYTLTVWVAASATGQYQAKIGISGLSETVATAITGTYTSSSGYMQMSYGFEATSTSHTITLSTYRNAGSTNFTAWDDIRLTRDSYTPVINDWAAVSPSLRVVRDLFIPHTGAAGLGVYAVASAYKSKATHTVTGLTPGLSYTLRAWAYRSNSGKTAIAGVTGKGSASVSGWTNNVGAWKEVVHTFTASATSHELYLEGDYSGSGSGTLTPDRWDDITLTQDAYTSGSNNGLDGGALDPGALVSNERARTGTFSVKASSSGGKTKNHTLAIGEPHSASVWVYVPSDSTATKVSVLLDTVETMVTTFPKGTWFEVSTPLTEAHSASKPIAFSVTGGIAFFDDVSLKHRENDVYTYTPELVISDGKVTLDENYSPYVRANFTVPLTDEKIIEQIDPRDNQRVTVTATEGIAGTTRTFDLGLRSRTIDHKNQTVEIELASDELKLFDRVNVSTSVDSSARSHEASVRAICTWGLGKIGASLSPGSADADLTATWNATNLQTNPSAGANLDGWTATGGTTSRITGISIPGTSITTAVRSTMGAGQPGGLYFNGGDDSSIAGGVYNVRISGKQLYRVSAWVRTSVSKTIRLSVQQRNSGNTQSGANLNGPDFTTTANTWHRLTYVFQAYPESVRMGVYCYLTSGTWSAGQTIDMAGVMVTEGTTDTPSFDGSTTIRTDLYSYTWSGTPHLSTSERTAFFLRPPELFDWKPGQSLFDFLQPLINASGLRLYCDETRVWRLVDPAEFEVGGYVSVQSGHNATEGSDGISRDDDTWADAVVVIYSWTDADGQSKKAYDVAGDENGKCIVREIDREYPGPGAAQTILNSFQGRGRTQTVTVLGKYTCTPGQAVTIALPGTLTQTGKIREVTFDLKSGLMFLGTRGLTDALDGSWATWDPEETWAEVNPTLLWKDA